MHSIEKTRNYVQHLPTGQLVEAAAALEGSAKNDESIRAVLAIVLTEAIQRLDMDQQATLRSPLGPVAAVEIAWAMRR